MSDTRVQAFNEAFRGHYRYVFAIAFNILRDRTEAEDVAQEVFTELWWHWPELRLEHGDASLRAWLKRGTSWTCLNRLGRRPEEPYGSDPSSPEPGAASGGRKHDGAIGDRGGKRIEDMITLCSLMEAIESRTTPLRVRTWVLKEIDGYTAAETADILRSEGLSERATEGAVRVALHAVRRIIRALLEEP